MIVTGDVTASSSLDDCVMQHNVKSSSQQERLSEDRVSQQSAVSQERVQQVPPSCSHDENDTSAPLGDTALASVIPAALDCDHRRDWQTSDWMEMDQCIYPAGPVRQTNYQVSASAHTSPTHSFHFMNHE
jgi:hypothetical protein